MARPSVFEAGPFLRLPPGSRWRRPESFWQAPRRALALHSGKLIEWTSGTPARETDFELSGLFKRLRAGRWWLLTAYEFAARLEKLPQARSGLQALPELLALDFSGAREAAAAMPVQAAPDFESFLSLAGLRRIRTGNTAGACLTRTGHARRVRAIITAIGAGDYYQANLTRQFAWRGRIPGDALADRLFAAVQPDYGLHLRVGDLELISISPELLVAAQDGRLRAEPVAGSRPRGPDDAADRRLKRELLASAKDIAEHEMLVDLARNDLGKIARFGSVRVEGRRRVEMHARVMSMVSAVTAELAPGKDVLDALLAAFPGGTISGCPKPAVLAALRRIEPCARGYYTGSFGWLENGEGVFNILIRTLTMTGAAGRRRLATWGAGGGIVHDSDAASEWRELLAKGEALQQALNRAAS